MNFVKGVADLIRRTSAGQSGDFASASRSERFSLPSPKIRFSEVGDEAILNTLWDRYDNSFDKVEKRKLFYVFLKQFLIVYRNWEPPNVGQSPDHASSALPVEYSAHPSDVVIGCSNGHPSEIIHVLAEEVTQITAMVTECTANSGSHMSTITYEGLPVLDALAVITRSMHNCRVFGFYGGVQKLTALLKATVVQLKTISSALSADESLPTSLVDKSVILQKILIHVVLVLCSFIDLHSGEYENTQLNNSSWVFYEPKTGATSPQSSTSVKAPYSETLLQWHHRAIVLLMEAGGLNWLVELLRVLRRLIMKEQWIDLSLQYLTLRTLKMSLADNPRGQNHFRSIGGLEVLLDGLGVSSNNAIRPGNSSFPGVVRTENPLQAIFQLHVLSLEILREAVFGNMNNLQFLSENGRVQKFANSFCSLAFMLQDYKQQELKMLVHDDEYVNATKLHEKGLSPPAADSQNWNHYVTNLIAVLCSFLLGFEDTIHQNLQPSTGTSTLPVSSAYLELSIKWFLRVLLTIFPCIKACSYGNELPSHLRIFVYTLQHSVLLTFRKILILLPSSLDVFRAEGAWDFIFSENLFYYGPTAVEFSGDNCSSSEGFIMRSRQFSGFTGNDGHISSNEVEVLQVEAISFLELAATLSGISHNLAECSVLLDALEQSVANPEIANVLAKSLLHVMQLSPEKTVSSFKALDAIPRVLKVASILAQESKRHLSSSFSETTSEKMVFLNNGISDSPKTVPSWRKSVETCLELFAEYFVTDDAKIYILHSSACIDCLFDLFWEEDLRNRMLKYILDLMKVVPSSEEDRKAKLYLSSKYLETFTHVKEREMNFAELSVDLLVGMRNILLMDQTQYRALFRDGECFLHIVSLLNGNLDATTGEKLVLNVLQTLTCLLSGDDASKAAFRALVGKGYQTLQSLLLDFCQWQPSESLLSALLDMLVDGKFDLKASPLIKNEDVILLYLNVLQKSSDSERYNGLNVLLQLLRDSISNRDSCVRAGILNFLLDWFSQEDNVKVVLKIAHLIQVTGGYSISGKDIRKIFALLRSEKVGTRQQYSSLLLTSMLSMLNEKGPTAFFDFNGIDSGVMIKTPVHWPLNKGFSFSCWLRVESFPRSGTMSLFSFLTESGRGCFAVLAKDWLIYESNNQKHQAVSLQVNLVRKKWHFLCLTHTIGRAFSGGSQLRCFVDGVLVSSEKCRYAKVNEVLTSCSIGAKLNLKLYEEDDAIFSIKDSSPFFGQIGPVYLFNDAITPEQVQGVYSLGPSYMYSFLDNEVSVSVDNPLPGSILDAKDGLSSRIIFGLNAQASNGRTLYNVSPSLEHLPDDPFEANVLMGTQLCSRRLLQQIIYCVGGVSVFFPLFTQSDLYEHTQSEKFGETLLTTITKERLTAEIIELIASVLDENLANQQQMLLLSGFSILGFLLQSVPPQQLNLETLSALKHLFNVVANSGLSDALVEDAIFHVFLNPFIWVYTVYKVQRELYMFLIQQLDNDPRLLKSLCKLPCVLDIIRKFYWTNAKSNSVIGSKQLLLPGTNQVIGERPDREEVHKIRLLLLSLGEMSLRQHISVTDIKALVAFFETSQDMSCIEDVLHMVIRAVSQKPLLASFLEQLNLLGGCHIFVNLLEREFEPIRLLSLQFIGRLLVGLPPEKKGSKFFNIAVGRSKSLQEGYKKVSLRMQPIFSMISDRLFKFPQTDVLCATLFDVLLGGASPKQVLQKHNQTEQQRSSRSNSQFFLPQILGLIFRFLSGCEDAVARIKIVGDLLDLLDSNPSNIEALMENGWNAWLLASVKLDVVKNYQMESQSLNDIEMNERMFVRSLYCCVLCHYIVSVKGGWQQLEETMNFLHMECDQGGISYHYFLHDVYADITQRLVSIEENIFVSQPCRDNVLYLLKLVDDILIFEVDHKIPFPTNGSGYPPDFLEIENRKDVGSVLSEALQGEPRDDLSRNPWMQQQDDSIQDEKTDDEWWIMYDNIWIIISMMNGKGPSKALPRSSSTSIPSFSQRARGLVESLNIPAAEMAAVVVSGGISNALGGKPNKTVDKAMLLRGEKCPRIVFRLMILYLCKSSLERASRCVQQFIPLLPSLLTADDEQSKNRVQLFIWALLAVRSHYGISDDGARIHVLSHLIRETVNCSKLVLASSMSRDDSSDLGGNPKEPSAFHNLIQKDRVIAAVADEMKYIKGSTADRTRQLDDLRFRMDEVLNSESNQQRVFEDETQSNLSSILASDDGRRASFQLACDEEQQSIAEKWIHMFRSLIDERGPWSAKTFPNNSITHWKLDKTEDGWRRRQKLRRNYRFNEKLCYPSSNFPNSDALSTVSDAKTGFGAHIPEQMKRFLLKGIRKITDEGTSEMSDNDAESSNPKASTPEDLTDRQYPETVKDSSNLKDIVQDRKDSSNLTSESENNEVLKSVPCVLVTLKRKFAGRLAVMKNYLHFFGEFLVEGTGGSSVFKNFDSSGNLDHKSHDQLGVVDKQKFYKFPIGSDLSSERGSVLDRINAVQDDILQKQYKDIKRHRRWNISKIKAVHWTRYLLRYTAIEVFFNNSVAPVFFNFSSQKDAKDVGNLIVATRNESITPKGYKDKSGAISFVDRRVALEMAETARESWRRRDITNFEYLMILNTLSGRSYNDLTQYPVFPWVLADYSSESLDFNKSSTFRDLSKPVGALDLKRFEVFEDRYRNFCDPDIPSFYYGSHYSSMGIVLFYLLRLEPFTALHRNLQGGKFDHADRLFQSIEGTYKNCLSNTSDVKELIPEFFYMPEFLGNTNSYHFGVRQDGEPLGDVLLPTWAKGSAEEFISKNREALESEYVSSNLHHWIDLVFGYKQRGKPAVEAANVFYYLTYEGAVDLDTMDDELQRSAIEDQIANFGQTPIQIFRKKHPRRGPPIPITHPLKFAPASINLTSIASSSSNSAAVLYVQVLDSSIVLVNQGLTMSVKIWLTTQLQSGGNFTFSGSQDPFFGVGSDVLSPRKIGSPLAETLELGAQCFSTLQMPSENFLISCGTWENSFQVISLADGRMVQSIRQHKDIVSCIAVTSDGSILVTGSYDTTVMVWEVNRLRATEKRVRNAQAELPRRDSVIAETPFHILCGHDDIITCLFASVELDIVISGSKDGTCVFHTLREGRYVRSLQHPSGCAISKLVVSRHGRIVVYADDDLSLHLYSINGKHISSSESSGRLNCMGLSSCGQFLVCAGDQGQIVVWCMYTLEVVRRYTGIGKVITSLTVTPEECFIAGTKDGSLLVYSIDNPQLRKSNVPRNLKT
nr:BEACH domain-containing protein B isoform X2 [Coffea arabica]XP_027094521.1 BEACH domain-containing protein B isoform X3 [Coffea arabica]